MDLEAHLTDSQLAAIATGRHDEDALGHLVECSRCQQAVAESSWLSLLRRIPDEVVARHHPDHDALVGFVSHALSGRRAMWVRRHLQCCDQCLALFDRERRSERRHGYSTPNPTTMDRTRADLRPRPIKRLGTLVVSDLGRSPRMALHAPTGAESSTLEAEATVSVTAGKRKILFGATRDGRLRVRVLREDLGEPEGGRRVRWLPQSGKIEESVTDEWGIADLSVTAGVSEIRIDTHTPLSIRLQIG